jgi:16S rRNA (uracil1498-N3)-methyltransferase
MRRFYLEPEKIGSDEIELVGALARRIVKVLRLRAGDEIALFDGNGVDVHVRLDDVTDRRVTGSVLARVSGPLEPRVRVHLYQSITKGDRFEWLIEKATELGVASVVPLVTARAVVRPEAEGNRAERWRRIAVEAAEQCQRSVVPVIGPPERFDGAIASAPGVRLLPYEAADHLTPNIQTGLTASIDELFALAEVSVFIGPEGGFEAAEVELARSSGGTVVTMGERVLRSETAGLTALTLVMQAVGELG